MSAQASRGPGAGPPPLLAAAAVLFWGGLTRHWIIAVIVAAALEAHRVIRWRGDITNELFTRVWNLCTVLFATVIIIAIVRGGLVDAVYIFVTWLPVVLLPIVLAQRFAAEPGVPTSAFSFIARRRRRAAQRRGAPVPPVRRVDLAYPYVCLVLVAACAANVRIPVFYAGAVVLLGWALWVNASRPSLNPVFWAVALLVVGGLGFVGHIGLHKLHLRLEQGSFLFPVEPVELDPNLGFTKLGEVGKLKLSPAIAWRARMLEGQAPAHLRTGTYTVYDKGLWYNPDFKAFGRARSEGPETSRVWHLAEPREALSQRRIALQGKGRRDVTYLALPGTPVALHGPPADSVGANGVGAVRAVEAPRVLRFTADYHPGLHADPPPSARDTEVPGYEHPGIARVARKLALQDPAPRQTVDRLERFFCEEFTYTMDLEIDDEGFAPPLVTFLETEKKGHCEYFASATVLLLRHVGIPARYVVGFGVSEYDKRRKEYVVRGIHAHAWAQAWIDGRWETIDNTPPSWMEADHDSLSWFQPVRDWFGRLPFAFAEWKETAAGRRAVTAFKWGALPLVLLYITIRLFKGQRARTVRVPKTTVAPVAIPGTDSECYALEQRLAATAGPRPRGEPLRLWWQRIRRQLSDEIVARVNQVIDLHYRLRFAPGGLDETGRERLRALVAQSLESLGPPPTSE